MSIDLTVVRCFNEYNELEGSSNAVIAYAWRDMNGKEHKGEMFLGYSYKRKYDDSGMTLPNYIYFEIECKNKATGPLASIIKRHFHSAGPRTPILRHSHEEALSYCGELREKDIWDIGKKGERIIVPPYYIMGSLSEPGWKFCLGRGRFDKSLSPVMRTPFSATELSTGRQRLEDLYDPINLMYFRGGPSEIDKMRLRRTMAIMRGLKKFVEWRKENVE